MIYTLKYLQAIMLITVSTPQYARTRVSLAALEPTDRPDQIGCSSDHADQDTWQCSNACWDSHFGLYQMHRHTFVTMRPVKDDGAAAVNTYTRRTVGAVDSACHKVVRCLMKPSGSAHNAFTHSKPCGRHLLQQ